MNILPKAIFIGFLFSVVFAFPKNAQAATLASQITAYADSGGTWSFSQDLGNSLSGIAGSITVRLTTSSTIDYLAQNSFLVDISNNYQIVTKGCVSDSWDPNDLKRGLTINTTGVPSGYEDVTIDLSCANYSFVIGHSYVFIWSNANSYNILTFAAHRGEGGSHPDHIDYFPSGGIRYNATYQNAPNCYQTSGTPPPYITYAQNCYSWDTDKQGEVATDDLYFILSGSPPQTPVIFIPGIGGSELAANGDIFWNAPDGHGGMFSHAYASGEKIWVNQQEAVKLGDDDYFDVLRLKADGVTPEIPWLILTGNLNSFGYSDIDSFFQGLGYVKGTNYFLFNYDWRKDVSLTKGDLDSLIETAKTKTGLSQVNIVSHSLGGLVARNYISDSSKASKVNKLIELGVPHLGTPWALRSEMYGAQVGPSYLFGLIGLNTNEVKDVVQNFASVFQLLPSKQYYSFYNNSDQNHLYPFRDDRDIDSNKIIGSLNYDQTKTLLQNLNLNMTVFNIGEAYHTAQDPNLSQANGVKLFEIIGSSEPTLGQIRETWWITWPINILPRKEEIFTNGDDTVPLFSASLKDGSNDLSSGATIYYVNQHHADLVSGSGAAMQEVKNILANSDTVATLVQTQKISLEGVQVSADGNTNLDLYDENGNHTGLDLNGKPETNIPETYFDTLDDTKHSFVKTTSPKKVTYKISTPAKTKVNVKVRFYKQDSINKTDVYTNLALDTTLTAQFTLDPSNLTTPKISLGGANLTQTSEAAGSSSLDQTPPTTAIQISGDKDSSGNYIGSATVTLTPTDTGSGVAQTDYSLDSGKTVLVYSGAFTISQVGTTTIQFFSTDKAGNQEAPQTASVTIVAAQTTNSNSTPSGNFLSASQPSPTPTPTQASLPGPTFATTALISSKQTSSSSENPPVDIASQKIANLLGQPKGEILGEIKAPEPPEISQGLTLKEILLGLLVAAGGASLALGVSFLNKLPFSKKLPK